MSSTTTNKPTRLHPPRLQHSPSLPNIWFPPHSGPLPSQLEDVIREPLQRPSTPNRVTPADHSRVMEHRGTLSFDGSYTTARPLKIQRRRRVDREHGHSLLTPPLTPSSSLRTATSIDSASAAGTTEISLETSAELLGDDANESTRFLLVGNISSHVSPEDLKTAIVNSLTSPHTEPFEHSNTLSVPTTGAQHGSLTHDSIKGVFVRCQKSHGIVMLAFFDPRHAARAKKILSTPSSSPLADCVNNESTEDGSTPWIYCDFISADKLAEIIGHSAFLASIDGSFLLLAEGRENSLENDGKEVRVVDDRSIDEGSDPNEDAVGDDADIITGAGDGINLNMLKSLLKSFGTVRVFSLVKDIDPTVKPYVKVFHVEYYDLRQANAAYAALHGQVLFGMKLKVSGRGPLEGQTDAQPQPSSTSDLSIDSPKNVIPFPTSTELPMYQSDPPSQFAPPGEHSHTRERFIYDDAAQSRQRSVSAGHDGHSTSLTPSPTPTPPHPGLLSPTFFYTSIPAVGSDASTLSYDSEIRRSSGHFAFDAVGRSHEFSGNTPDGEYGAEHLHGNLQGSHHDCYYCPSRGASGDCYSYPPSSPLYHPPVQRSPLVPPSLPLPSPTPMFGPGYSYDNHHTLAANSAMNMNMTTSFEQSMIPVSHPAPGETWYPTPNMVPHGYHGVPFYPPQIQVPTGYGAYGPPLKPEPPLQIDPPPRMNDALYRQDPVPSSSRMAGCAASPRTSTSNTREPPPPPERNQLNLARIADGQDTRTTVMIKNIPNKMSDKDLVAFIGKVCSRKIDFLYLRMDFQNGCNVGYAFVNFIDVQDLLYFAKRKLGEKWNMFSSEKVLQMSYANYQGKEALVEKFKNSCIMDEREAWRPKIFYSEPGPEQGLPEPFPAPTHLRRKERSSFNRGALYVPGVGRGSGNSQMITQNSNRRQSQREVQLRSHYLSADRRRQDVEEVNDRGQYPEPRRRSNKLWIAS